MLLITMKNRHRANQPGQSMRTYLKSLLPLTFGFRRKMYCRANTGV